MKKCNEFIERKNLLYKTDVEYGDYCLNHVQGCAHGCKYPCYAYLMAKRFGKVKTYEEWTTPKLVSNIDEILDKEIPKLKDKIDNVHLCFTTDPFMYEYSDICKASVNIIKKLNSNGIKCTALTKGVFPVKDLLNTNKQNNFGITLISLNEEFRKQIESGSAPYNMRIEALRRLHDAGFKTWVSIEPYPTPNIIEQDFEKILNAVDFVDKIIFGRLHYNKLSTSYLNHKEYYNELSSKVIEFCEDHEIKYHIKKGTKTEEFVKM